MSAFDLRHEAVYRELEADRGSPPPGEAFEVAIHKRAVSEYLQGDMSLDDLWDTIDEYADTEQKFREARQRHRSSTSDEVPAQPLVDHRARALRDILAHEAATDEAVSAFRAEFLQEGLLDISDISVWITRTRSRDGDPTAWITVPEYALRKGMSPDDPALNRLQGYSEYVPSLTYMADKTGYPLSVPIRLDGVLGELKTISQRIAYRYDWDLAATTTFILTGQPPEPRGLRVHSIEPWPWPHARKRIVLDAPLNTTPDEVTRVFRTVRSKLLGDEPVTRRSLKERSADLAVFASRHSTGYTWNEARAIWNRQHRKTTSDRYTDSDKFVRASKAAYKRITGKNLDWAGNQPSGTADPRDPKEN